MTSSTLSVTLVARLQFDEDAPLIRSAGRVVAERTHVRTHAQDVLVGHQEIGHALVMADHLVEADALGAFGIDVEAALILARQEALRDDAEQVDGHAEQHDRNHHRHGAEAQRAAERDVVEAAPGIEQPLERVVERAVRVRRLEEAAAQHRRQADGDEPGDQNRRGDGDRELVEEPADDAAQEQHRDEDRHERQGHRQDREGHFA